MQINKQCLETIMCHLTGLIQLTEFDNIEELVELVDMATSVSAQLLVVCDNTNAEEPEE